jgi:transcriptional regulator with XRE-family HTH domain
VGTPLGDFVRAKRDSIQPEALGLPARERRRAPGLRRSELAVRAGISVEYLTRIEQGRDRNPSPGIVNALADALSLGATERNHLRYLAKITGGACSGHRRPVPPRREVRSTVSQMLRLLEPGIALVTNRLGDILEYTSGYELLMAPSGLLQSEGPNLTRYVFTDPRARVFFPDWDQVADEQTHDLWLGPSVEAAEWFRTQLSPAAGPEFTRRLDRHIPPPSVPLRIAHTDVGDLRWNRERLALPSTDHQEIVVYLPADNTTSRAWETLRHRSRADLRAVN